MLSNLGHETKSSLEVTLRGIPNSIPYCGVYRTNREHPPGRSSAGRPLLGAGGLVQYIQFQREAMCDFPTHPSKILLSDDKIPLWLNTYNHPTIPLQWFDKVVEVRVD